MKKTIQVLASLIFILSTSCGQQQSGATKVEQSNDETDSISVIKETCLIEILPEARHFDDEDSEEAQNYYVAMDDWYFYMAETKERFEKTGIRSVVAEKRYLSFTLADNEKFIVDTEEKRNDAPVSALLYKKGHIPITIDIIDNDMETINEYLKEQ